MKEMIGTVLIASIAIAAYLGVSWGMIAETGRRPKPLQAVKAALWPIWLLPAVVFYVAWAIVESVREGIAKCDPPKPTYEYPATTYRTADVAELGIANELSNRCTDCNDKECDYPKCKRMGESK